MTARPEHAELLRDIETFLSDVGMGPAYFGKVAVRNSDLVKRLKSGGRIWPETEREVRDFMAVRRAQEAGKVA